MSNYNVFAKYYDSVMGDRTEVFSMIESWIKKYNPNAKRVLELACGTGSFLKLFSNNGYEIAGIDSSAEMLAEARKKLPESILEKQDMTNFLFTNQFDAIICLFDSINHLLSFDDWSKVFIQSNNHLNINGIFIFDINTSKSLDNLVKSGEIKKNTNGNEISMSVTKQHNFYNWKIKIIEYSNNKEKIFFENIAEQSFPISEIVRELKKRFRQVIARTFSGNDANEDTNRVYFICLK